MDNARGERRKISDKLSYLNIHENLKYSVGLWSVTINGQYKGNLSHPILLAIHAYQVPAESYFYPYWKTLLFKYRGYQFIINC